jgi:hypothetical protein
MATVLPSNLRLYFSDAQYRKISKLKENLIANRFSATFGLKEEDGMSWWWVKPYAEVFYTHRCVTVRFHSPKQEQTDYIDAVDLEYANDQEMGELADKVLTHVQNGMEAIKLGHPIPPIASFAHYYYVLLYVVLGFLWCVYKM